MNGKPEDIPIKIRSFQPTDEPHCRKLYAEGLIGGKLADNDTGLDIDDIQQAYLSAGNHFWVAEGPQGEVLGMVGVQHHEQDVGEIRRLRVRQDMHGRGIGSQLLETAVKFCVERSYLKIALDTWVERESAIRLFEKHHFRHERTKKVAGRELLYFYLDLYSGDRQPQRKD
jgi:ribosomal protein S18 acetylase RimI-like enzyme